jgi:hypothetical protein
MSIVLPFSSNAIPTFIYEPFSYTISNPAPGTYTLTTSNTPGIPPGYITNNGSNVVFAASSNGMNIGTEVFVVTATFGSTVLTSSNTVTVSAGRFLDASGVSYSGRNFSFFKSEPITPITLVAPFAIAVPTSVPTLPPGLTYTSNASNIYNITGTPLVTVPQSNYLVIGKATGANTGKIVTSQFGLSVSNERIRLNLSGSPIVSPMIVGTPISQRVLTAAYPPYPSGGTLRYSWFGLPDGIVVQDSSGNTQPFGAFLPTDASSTLVITGTPTIAAANAYRDAGITSNVVTFTATRTFPLPQISNSQAISFAFGETVLFDTPSVPTFYSGVTLDPSATFFRAQTYFGTASPISNIFSPDLRSDLSINFVPAEGRGYLTGTPNTTTGTASYTIRAINSNAISRDLSVPITVTADSVTFVSPPTPAVDVCYNFVLSRPSALALTGYYPSNIQFQAVAASGNSVTFSAPALAGTGLSLSNISSNTVQIVGIPETITPLTTVTVTASAVGTPATATRDISLSVVNDVITISDVSASLLNFIQNRAIAPVQFSATTLSERPVTSFSATSLPDGLSITTTGLLTGTPLTDVSSSFTVIASTGYTSQNKTFSYAITPDSALFLVNPSSYTYFPLDSVFIQISGLTYSGNALSNYTLSGFAPTYGLSLDSSTGIISGTLESGIPPGTLFPVTPDPFTVSGQAGLLSATLQSTFSVSNPVVDRSFMLVHSNENGIPVNSGLFVNDDTTLSNWDMVLPALPGEFLTFTRKNDTIDSNTYFICGGQSNYRSSNGVTWDFYAFGDTFDYNSAYKAINISNSSNWIIAGTGYDFNNDVIRVFYFTSSDDGVTWTRRDGDGLRLAPRRSSYFANYYTTNGVAFASNSGVLLLGGGYNSESEYFLDAPTLLRYTYEEDRWTIPTGINYLEIATFNTDASRWILVGSEFYSLGANTLGGYFAVAGNSIAYSDDQGETWTNASGVVPRVGTYNVSYASNTWIAAGMDIDDIYNISTRIVWSSDGSSWSNVSLPETFTQFSNTHLPEVGPIWADSSNWYLFVRRINETISPPNYDCTLYKHSLTGDLGMGWTVDVSGITTLGVPTTYISSYDRNFVRLGIPTTATLSFDTLPPGGPVVVSPTQRDFTAYQYVPITPIVFSATGVGQIYFFAVSSELPTGLTFDPITATLSGTSVVLGSKSFSIYVKDSVGITQVIISINTILPRVIRQQTSAGSWTSLVRQYTVVNAAQNSVNGRTLPSTEPPLGEFTRPEPPDSVSAEGNPNCRKC